METVDVDVGFPSGFLGTQGDMWDMEPSLVKFGNAELILLNKPPLGLTTLSWTLAPLWAHKSQGVSGSQGTERADTGSAKMLAAIG